MGGIKTMNRIVNRRLFGTLGAVFLTAGSFAAAMAPANATSDAGKNSHSSNNVRDVCGTAKPGYARCFAQARTDVHGGKGVRGPAAHAASGRDATLPEGFGPADLHSAYNLPMTGGADQTIAIVDAGDDPYVEADLAVYRATYGLPACTTANGCFHKVNQRGADAPLPPKVPHWGGEFALDVEMASAICPECKILLVEADDNATNNLAASADTAVALGATEVSASYGAQENRYTHENAADYKHPGVAMVAATGDNGFQPPSEPAVFDSVIAVGGTTLARDKTSDRGWYETAWWDAGSGCSAWFDKPAWQTDPNCTGRTVADISILADPWTGPAVYVTDPDDGYDGWTIIGGTSASAPMIAGVIALGGHPEKFDNASSFYTPQGQAGLNDVVGGTNSWNDRCGGDYLCWAVPGYDAVTGWGTPNGLSAFK